MSAEQLIAEYNALPIEQRQKVAEAIMADDSWVPDSFRQGMKDLEEGRVVEMERH